jgi:hypothetical protein
MSLYKNSTQTAGSGLKFKHVQLKSNTVFLGIIIMALIAFEAFNYSTTEFALKDVLGELEFLGIRWATILTVAFCGIDFAGIARLFNPGKSGKEPTEVWYLFGAWLLAATMNAMLTWWGVSMALANHQLQSQAVLSVSTLTRGVPVFVAVMVWLIRILIIGSLSMASDRILNGTQQRSQTYSSSGRIFSNPITSGRQVIPAPTPTPSFQPIRRQAIQPDRSSARVTLSNSRAEPIYTSDDNTESNPTIRPEPVYQSMAPGTKSSGTRQF